MPEKKSLSIKLTTLPVDILFLENPFIFILFISFFFYRVHFIFLSHFWSFAVYPVCVSFHVHMILLFYLFRIITSSIIFFFNLLKLTRRKFWKLPCEIFRCLNISSQYNLFQENFNGNLYIQKSEDIRFFWKYVKLLNQLFWLSFKIRHLYCRFAQFDE